MIKEIDNKYYFEDALLTWKILETIKACHDLEIRRVYRHAMVAGFEVDAVAICKTSGGKERWIGFELKEADFPKAFAQALLRRDFFDYFYVVIDLPVREVVNWILNHCKKGVEGIGFVSAYDDIIVLASKFKRRREMVEEVEANTILPVTQIKLIEFLQNNRKRWKV